MSSRSFVITGLLFAATAVAAEADLLDQGYRQMYDLQFAQAHSTFREFEWQHPDDPMGPVSDAAAYLFAEFDRLHILQSEFFVHEQHFMTDHKLVPDPALKQRFDGAIADGRHLATRLPGDQNALFAQVLANGLHADYLALIEKRYAASFQEMKAGRQMAEKLLARDPQYYDAWLAVGVENYMLSVKALPLRWLLRLAGGETDKAVGMEKLRLTAAKGHYLAPFARLLLAVAALREQDNATARKLLDGLIKDYPHNPLYAQERARLTPIASWGPAR